MLRDADPVESQLIGQAQLFLRSAHGFADRLTVAQGWRHRPGRCRGISCIRHWIQKADLHSNAPLGFVLISSYYVRQFAPLRFSLPAVHDRGWAFTACLFSLLPLSSL